MLWKNVAYLMLETTILDKLYRPHPSYIPKKIFCNIKSVGQNEFYQAEVAGLKPEIKIETKLIDLSNVGHVKIKDKLYKILRTYRQEDIIEIVLTSMVVANE